MPFLLYDYLDAQGENDFLRWTKTLQSPELGKLNQKLDMLERHGEELLPQTLTGTAVAGIYKLRVQGSIKLRPMLTKGPVGNEQAFTLLIGAKEVGSAYKPANADTIANQRKQEVIADPAHRRKCHERLAKKTT